MGIVTKTVEETQAVLEFINEFIGSCKDMPISLINTFNQMVNEVPEKQIDTGNGVGFTRHPYGRFGTNHTSYHHFWGHGSMADDDIIEYLDNLAHCNKDIVKILLSSVIGLSVEELVKILGGTNLPGGQYDGHNLDEMEFAVEVQKSTKNVKQFKLLCDKIAFNQHSNPTVKYLYDDSYYKVYCEIKKSLLVENCENKLEKVK